MPELNDRVSALFEADKPEVRQVAGPLVVVRASGEACLTQAQRLSERSAAVLPRGAGVFHEDHRALLDRQRDALVHQALVYIGADLAWQNSLPDLTPREERRALTDRARAWDTRLMKRARAEFDGDTDIETILADIQTGTGHRDDAEDVLRLLGLFFERWDTVGARLPWPRAELETLEADMTRLLVILRPKTIAQSAAALLRQQAFTRFVRTFNEVLDACRYLARHQPDTLAELKGLSS